MTDHATQREKTGAYILGLLPEDERREFEAHLSSCLECVREVRELADVTAALADSVQGAQPPARVRAAILDRITARPANSIDRSALSARGGAAQWWLAAASIAFVVAVGYASVMRGRVVRLDGELAAARDRLAATETAITELRRTAASAGRVTIILAAADVTRIDLAG